MSSQDDKDWEEYQLGQQGTPTGSVYNQQGLNDRYQAPRNLPNKKPKRTNIQQQGSNNKSNVNNEEDFSYGFALITFVIIAYSIYIPGEENGTASLIGAGIAALIAGKYYKFIIIMALVIVGFIVFGDIKDGGR